MDNASSTSENISAHSTATGAMTSNLASSDTRSGRIAATISSLFCERANDFDSAQLLWLDQDINAIEQNLNIQNILKEFTSDFYAFDDCDSCVDHLTDGADRKVVLIIAERLGHRIIPVVHDFLQLKAVYIHCTNESANTQWSKDFDKIRGIFKDMDKLVHRLNYEQRRCDTLTENRLQMNVYSQEKGEQKESEEQRDKKNASFMFFLVFIDILLKMPRNDEKAKQELVRIWREVCSGNEHEEKVVKEFENDCQPNHAIWWYTRNAFLYHTLNKSLRDHNIDIMFAMRSFIVDLYTQLSGLHQLFRRNYASEPIIQVYRGQSISSEEIDLIRTSQGKLVTFNSFLSTSTDRRIARSFAESCDTTNLARILFEFRLDTSLTGTKPYADISAHSYFHGEQEILLTLGTVFRIDEMEYDEHEQIWLVKLSLCSETDFELKDLLEGMKKDISNDRITSLGWLLYWQGEYKKAKQFFEGLLSEELLSDFEKANCYSGLSSVAETLKEYDVALTNYHNALSLCMKYGIGITTATTYMAIGQVYWRKKEFDLALINEQNALEILLPLNHRQLSVVYGIMANIYRDKNELHSAIQCSEKALTVDRQYLPSNHSNFGTTYTNMGLTYDKMGDYKQALVCYAKARDVFLKSLPPTHPDILVLEQNIRDAEAEINHD